MPWYKHFLWPFAILFASVVWLRNRLFDFGVLPSRKFDIPIICVGNLEVGGTGKSPIVMYLVDLLRSNSLKVAVLSRGYGRRTKGFLLAEKNSSVADVGDEAKQVKTRFPNVIVAVSENRVIGVERMMCFDQKPDVIIMDDGFQHRRLTPSLSILTTSGKLPFWKNYPLPVGTLRESRTEAERAEVLIMPDTNSMDVPTRFDLSVFRTKMKTKKPVQIIGDQYELQDSDKVILLSGIGNPKRFENTAEELFDVVDHVKCPDHHIYAQSDFKLLRKKIDSFEAAVSAVLTTEKDAMRLMDSPLLNELGGTAVFYLPIDVSIVGNEEQKFDRMILEHARKN